MIFARNDGAGQFSRELCFDHESWTTPHSYIYRWRRLTLSIPPA
jgi:hypothetical protein